MGCRVGPWSEARVKAPAYFNRDLLPFNLGSMHLDRLRQQTNIPAYFEWANLPLEWSSVHLERLRNQGTNTLAYIDEASKPSYTFERLLLRIHTLADFTGANQHLIL